MNRLGSMLRRRVRNRLQARALEKIENSLSLGEATAWRPYRGLTRTSLTLAHLEIRNGQRSVNLVLGELSEAAIFAGIRTALAFGGELATALGCPLRIVVLSRTTNPDRLAAMIAQLVELPVARVSICAISQIAESHFAPDDVWVATYWTTAHALDVAAEVGVVERDNVVYLVQDYEPEFFPGSTESAVCRTTYDAGFELVVNSRPVYEYLRLRERVVPMESNVFRPDLDLERLAEAAERRRRVAHIRIAFYARPSKPRNSFALGLSALSHADHLLRSAGIPSRFVSVGESHPHKLVGISPLKGLGKLSWAGYFDLLGDTDIMLSLQQTPHPSHPPLDAVASGTFAVTNEHGNTRSSLSPRLIASDNTPRALATALAEAAVSIRENDSPATKLDQDFLNRLGAPMTEVVRGIATRRK